DFQVAAGERDFATELIVVELRLSWWRKECAVNLFISQAAPVQQIVGQIHQALRAAEIDFPGLQAGYRLEVLVVEITRFLVFMGRNDAQGQRRVTLGQRRQLFSGNHVILSANEVEKRHRCPIVLICHGVQLAQNRCDAAATGNEQYRLGRLRNQELTESVG